MIVLENRVNLPTNQIQNLKHLHLGHSRFPALQALCFFSLAYDMMQTFALIGPRDNPFENKLKTAPIVSL